MWKSNYSGQATLMKRLFGHIRTKLALVITICVLLISSGCSISSHEGFAIYLTKEDIPPAQMEALSHVDIAAQPIISIGDIITYNAQTHELTLTDAAFERISQLEVPVSGRSFMVCVNKTPIYLGAFWAPISSMSFNGVTILKPLGSAERKSITFRLGYPSPSFYEGEDPRNNAEVMKSLLQAGKLVNIGSGLIVVPS
jgi:hypothetical protein